MFKKGTILFSSSTEVYAEISYPNIYHENKEKYSMFGRQKCQLFSLNS